MKNRIIKLTGLSLLSLAIAGCNISSDFSNPVGDSPVSSGSADFTTFVTIGDSLTAGYADSALYLEGQNNSYPAILAQQFAKVGGSSSFSQPLVSDNLGGLLAGAGNQITANRLILDVSTTPPTPKPIAGTPTTDVLSFVLNGNTYNNMGVPGAKLFHLGSASYGDPSGIGSYANPYYVRFATSPAFAGSSMIADAAAQQPSFFIMWAGNNDVLSYATAGGIGVSQVGNADPATYGSNDITDPGYFGGVYNSLVAAFTSANAAAKGMLVNIPDIGTIPYFTTVPYNAVPLDQATADALNAGFAAYNAGVAAYLAGNQTEAALRTISFSAGQNAVLILDEDLTDLTGFNAALINMRQATTDDLLLLTASSKIGTAAPSTKLWGITEPLQDGDVLIPSEIQAIEIARVAFNIHIKNAADSDTNLIFFDAAAVMNELSTTGIAFGSGYVDNTYASGGAFSLDGVHPTARGYAVISNRMIDTINSELGATIPPVDPGTYGTIYVK